MSAAASVGFTRRSLLRRRAARVFLGVSDRRFRRLVAEGALVPRLWRGRGRAWYVVAERRRLRAQFSAGGMGAMGASRGNF